MAGFPVFIFVVAVVVVIIVIALRAAHRRAELLRQWAAANGWRMRAGKDGDFDECHPFSCLQRGHSRHAYNIVDGNAGGERLIAFDYRYTTGSGKDQHTYTFSAVILDSPFPLKGLVIRPEGFFDKLASMVGFDDIDFESEDFSRQFFVKANDRRWAYDVLHPRAMELLMAGPRYAVEFHTTTAIVWHDRCLQPADFDDAIRLVRDLFQSFPDYLVAQQAQEA